MTGHVQTLDEKRRDAEQVRVLNTALYGVPFSPEDAHQARHDRDEDEAYWNALLASPDVATEEDAS